MSRTARAVWRHSLWLTLPITIVFVVWLKGTHERWSEFHVRQQTSDPLTLAACGALEAQHLMRKTKIGIAHPRKAAALQRSGLETVRLYLPESARNALDAHLPASGRVYVEGAMEYGGDVHDVDLRYRGDNVYHWGYWKKSWRVKTKRKSMYDGMRRFNLVAPRTPELLNNYLAYRLADHMGLIAPKSRLVNVMLNGELMGLYVMTEQLDESTIRRHERMPGDVYSGEVIGRDTYLGARVELFDHPGAWTKVAVNNHFDEPAKAPLRALLHHVQRATEPASRDALPDLVDIDAFARFSAFEALACTVHIDTVHNWRIYYDPWRTNFVPVVWDPVGWFHTMRPRPGVALRPDVITSPLHAALFQNGDFLRARYRVFASFLASEQCEAFLDEARSTVRLLSESLQLDPSLVAAGEWVSPERADREAHELLDVIERLFADLATEVGPGANTSVQYEPIAQGGDPAGQQTGARIRIEGRGTVEWLQLTLDRPIDPQVGAYIGWSERGAAKGADVSDTVLVTDRSVRVRPGLLANHRLSITSMEPEVSYQNGLFLDPATYDIELPLGGASIVGCEWQGPGEERWRRAERVEGIEPAPLGVLHRRVPDAPRSERVVWSGEVRVEEDQHIDRDLTIQAGTTIRMAPGASLFLRGKLRALGTERSPIRVEPLVVAPEGAEQEPWGTVALVGSGCNGSELRHCVLRLGSGSKRPLAEYTAMLSIHDVQNVAIEHCVFERNMVVDDMVHGVYSSVRFSDCVFRKSLFDALDMDISTVHLERCRFEESGNDSIDLMTAHASVVDTVLVGSVDKGISVGENSRLVAAECVFEDCAIAVQSKDESTAAIVNSDVQNCGVGLDAYKKNWRYDGGGDVFLYKSRIEGTATPVSADRHSRIALRDCYVRGTAAGDLGDQSKGDVTVDAVDGAEPTRARLPSLQRFPADTRALGSDSAAWRKTDPRQRGSKRKVER